MLPSGVTTVGSQGDAGAANWLWYRDKTVLASRTRVRLAINIGGHGEQTTGGSCDDGNDIEVDACVAAIEGAREWIWGIAINASTHACGNSDPREVMNRALEAAERTGLPLLYGPRVPEDWPFEEQFVLLRPGDVVTYFCRRKPYSLVANQRVLPIVREARERGILFDAVHGMGSFSFPVAEAAIADGFLPDTISTDLYAGRDGTTPSHDLPQVMSKFMAAGMPEREVFAAVTAHPARILGLEAEIGSLTVGACADLTVLRWNQTQSPPLVDVDGVERLGGRWETALTVRAGEVVR
jgi:dihydroorotase